MRISDWSSDVCSSDLVRLYLQLTLPDPVLLVEQVAPPAIVTSPEPSRLTSALPVAFASTSPEPVIDTSSVCATMPSASTSPDPVMRISADSAEIGRAHV